MCLLANQTAQSHVTVDEFSEARRKRNSLLSDKEKVSVSDSLAKSTQCTKHFFKFIAAEGEEFKKSSFYKIMTRTTQPAHVASILFVLTISYCMWPELHKKRERQSNQLTTLVYIGSFAAHFGAQLWMTFVSGLALYFALPRHTFGMCQEILFPKYFIINALLSSTTLVTFAKINKRDDETRWIIIQLAALSTSVVIEMTIYLYLTPSLLKLMRTKHELEQSLGNGQEIGHQEAYEGIQSRQYQKVQKAFRTVHIKCAIGNIVTICCSFIHLHYLALKLSTQ